MRGQPQKCDPLLRLAAPPFVFCVWPRAASNVLPVCYDGTAVQQLTQAGARRGASKLSTVITGLLNPTVRSTHAHTAAGIITTTARDAQVQRREGCTRAPDTPALSPRTQISTCTHPRTRDGDIYNGPEAWGESTHSFLID